ncbi:hypothetical protein GSI_11365 [Ganoderma sinense ZZ0214-1]|uniref:Uncharacterized protein n=1 Tax=Ganoderma sinense ZZ0214-1 TaxID=1077348 RepID=A0A2G8RVR6_9APHY|nr:hypothetical protein GSI_11365 [Ganoderma sinense ZZ0214-1]
MVFFPDNQQRANRLQQLVDSMADMQTDVKDIGTKMDEKNTQYRPAIDAILSANNLATIDDLIAATAARMTPQEQAVFEALIKTARASKSVGFDISYLVGSLLMAPEGVALTGTQAISIARWGSRMIAVKNMSNFCKAAEEGAEAAAEAASKIAAEAEDAEKALEGTGDASEAGEEAVKAATMMGRIGTFLKVLGGVGLVITLISGVIELVQGAEQKAKLIDAIHALQPSQLTTAFYKQEGTNIMNQLESLDDYLDAMPGGSDPDPDFAARTAKRIILHIQTENAAIDLGPLEDELEVQDRSSSLFYGGDDLSRDQVIAEAEQAQTS